MHAVVEFGNLVACGALAKCGNEGMDHGCQPGNEKVD